MSEKNEFDLIVVGGGTAGALSAIAAASEGLRVAVVERGTCLGGIATNSGITEMNAISFQSQHLYRGVEGRLIEQLVKMGSAEYHFAVPMSSNPDVKIDRLRYNPEILKLILEQAAVDSGAVLFYQTELESAQENEEGCQIVVRGLNRRLELRSKFLIDATGGACLVQALGGATTKVPAQEQMVATLMFRLSNVDLEQLDAFIHSEHLRQTVQEGYSSGVLKGRILAFTPVPGTRDISLNVTRAKFDFEDPVSFSQGLVEARAQIFPILDFVRSRVPGLAQAYISNISTWMGVRDTRHIVGRYTITAQDLENMTKFPDSIACGCYPMDMHDPVTNSVVWTLLDGVYWIPYRSLVPQNLSRTLAAGKCISAQRQAFAALRVMPIMMNVGESAGYAVALALRMGKKLDELDGGELTAFLKEKYQ